MELSRPGGAVVTFDSEAAGEATTIIRLGGELDASNVDALRVELASVIDDRPDRVLFDLAELVFFDSSGIALLIETANKVAVLEIRNPSDLIRRIIEATGLTQVFGMEQP